METVSLPPTLAERLNVLRKHIENDIEDAINGKQANYSIMNRMDIAIALLTESGGTLLISRTDQGEANIRLQLHQRHC
jgi:hypothetical protein